MNKPILCRALDHIADFLFHAFPGLDEEEQFQLFQGMSSILRWTMREMERQERQEWIKRAAETSQN